MGRPAVKQGDRVIAIDTHIVIVSGVPTPLPHPFSGTIDINLIGNVNVMGKPAATVGSTANNTPPHLPTAPGTGFQRVPANRATIRVGSPTVRINGKAAARTGDAVETCNDPADLVIGQVIGGGTVFIG